jgi:hypothetical protein
MGDVMTTSVSPSRTAHDGLAAHKVVLLLETDPHRGLTSEEATDRLARFGPNTLPAPRVPAWSRAIWSCSKQVTTCLPTSG